MSRSRFEFESLPNEIIVDIFEYIDIQTLFSIFYNLNHRLNKILKALNNLHLRLTTNDSSQIRRYNLIAPFVTILTIEGRTQLNLTSFTNVRRLILMQTTDEFLYQIERIHFPRLQYLSIFVENRRDDYSVPYFWNQIFTHDYQDLEICCMYQMNLKWTNLAWRSLSKLCILKLGDIDIVIYESILLACPNLYYLKFTRLNSNVRSKTIIKHDKLKKLVIVIPHFEELSKDCHTSQYFTYVPKLEQLTIHRTVQSKHINEEYLHFNWYIKYTNSQLEFLFRFIHYFHILKSNPSTNSTNQNIFTQIQRNFKSIHHKLCQGELILDFIG